MIFDEKKNLNFYRNLGIEGRYAKAVDFLMNTDLAALEAGKHEIDGTNVYATLRFRGKRQSMSLTSITPISSM